MMAKKYTMPRINVGRYEVGCAGDKWLGFIEPADKRWILFIMLDGTPVFFPKRDPQTGAVID